MDNDCIHGTSSYTARVFFYVLNALSTVVSIGTLYYWDIYFLCSKNNG